MFSAFSVDSGTHRVKGRCSCCGQWRANGAVLENTGAGCRVVLVEVAENVWISSFLKSHASLVHTGSSVSRMG